MRALLLAALCASALGGCEALWDLGNRAQLQRDVREVLGSLGLPAPAIECHMIGTTRAGACHLPAPAVQVEALTSAWPPVTPALGVLDSREACGMPGAPGREAPRGAPYLMLKSGGRFVYLRLYHAAASGTACVRAEYAYG